MNRTLVFYLYLVLLGGVVIAVNLLAWPYDTSHPDPLAKVLYLFVAVSTLNLVDVRLDRGHLTLGAIAAGAAAILLNPLDATVACLGIAFAQVPRRVRAILANAVFNSAIASTAASTAASLHPSGDLALGPRLLVLMTFVVANLAFVAVGLSLSRDKPVRAIVRLNFNISFFMTLGYMSLTALLISYVLDGSLLGYFLATIVCVLALALTDTIAGRRVRRVLESELSDADRHLFHSRAVEGVVHNLRNHMATALAYLKEIDTRKLESPDRESLETATDAANDAVAVLRDLAQGATPKVSYAPNPVDLNELVTRAVGMARPRARGKEVQFAVHEAPTDVGVKADPLLMREVMTNLLNNAIDAVSLGGRVEISTGRRSNGWPYVSVADNGPGVSDDHRHHLFEPHFTTKEGGTGLGLFMSYGIVREHQGQLLFEGNRRGAVFTVVLPPYSG